MRALIAAMALSATVVPQTLEQLCDRSNAIAHVRVTGQAAQKADGPAGIYTFSQLQILEALAGAQGGTIRLRQPGGTVGAETVELPGDARLQVGEEALVFLQCRPGADFCTLVGLAQGAYHLAVGADGTLQATRDFRSTAFVGAAPPSLAPERYTSLAARIRAHLRATRPR